MIKLIPEKCVACKQCVKICPFGAILLEGKTPVLSDVLHRMRRMRGRVPL